MDPINKFNIVVCASGGGGNFQAIIDAQISLDATIQLLIVDRQCGAINIAKANKIPYIQIPNQKPLLMLEKFENAIPSNTNLIILAGYLPILPSCICKKWQRKIINTHPSLLPKYGGKGMYGVKVQEAVMANHELTTGCTVHFVNEGIDEGEILLQKEILIDYNESPWELGGRIFQEENKLLIEAIRLFKKSGEY